MAVCELLTGSLCRNLLGILIQRGDAAGLSRPGLSCSVALHWIGCRFVDVFLALTFGLTY